MPVRRHHDPIVVPRHHSYGSSVRHDYGIDDSISRADYLSNAVLSDTFDAASRSRGRDQELMRSVNNAIVNTEQHISPKAAVVARRVRASTLPPTLRSAPVTQTQSQVIRQENVFYHTPSTGALHASRPPLPKPTDRKVIRGDDGFTKPKNLMSWQYRVESRVSPDDLIYEPARLSRMRDQVHGIHEKMDRHRQLLDRYLDSEFKPAKLSSISEGGSSVKIPAYYAAGGDPDNRPVSDLRRRLRRTIARAKNNPDYYRE